MKSSLSKEKAEYFENAPIILSILQFRYKKIENLDIGSLKLKGVSINAEYPQITERVIQQIHFEGNKPDGTTKVSFDEKEIDGVQFISKDKRKNLVIGKDRFTFEMHGKYTGWNDFTSEAKRHWETFQNELGNIELTGLSVRYINRINLPIDFYDISQYFTTFIQSSTGNHMINAFQIKYTSVEPEQNLTIHIGHALEQPIEDIYPYLFDIDVIYTSPISNEAEKIWEIFSILREKKNSIFNDGLSDKTKELIR